MKRKIAIYSGSFNPIHQGHLKLAADFLSQQLADELWFVVSPKNPLKNQPDMLDEYLRLDMVILAIQGYDGMKASDVEFDMPVPSYSIDTLRKLTLQFPDFSFSLLIGSDNAVIFDQWKDFSEILSDFPVWVYPRKGYPLEEALQRFPAMQALSTPFYDISSTEIREAIRRGEIPAEWLHPSVADFIRENELYLNDL